MFESHCFNSDNPPKENLTVNFSLCASKLYCSDLTKMVAPTMSQNEICFEIYGQKDYGLKDTGLNGRGDKEVELKPAPPP